MKNFEQIIQKLKESDTSLLVLKISGINIQQVAILANTLSTNNILRVLNISGNSLNDQSIKELARMLTENNAIKVLNLASNKIADQGATELAEALKINNTLNQLYLWNNNIQNQGAIKLANMLKTNISINCLELWNNSIEDKKIINNINNSIKISKELEEVQNIAHFLTANITVDSIKIPHVQQGIQLLHQWIIKYQSETSAVLTEESQEKINKYSIINLDYSIDKFYSSFSEILFQWQGIRFLEKEICKIITTYYGTILEIENTPPIEQIGDWLKRTHTYDTTQELLLGSDTINQEIS